MSISFSLGFNPQMDGASAFELTDSDLVKAVRSGDERAAEVLYDRYMVRTKGLIQTQLSSGMRPHLDAEDIVQSVFKSVFRGMSNGLYVAPDAGSLWKLFAIIAIHKVRRQLRRVGVAKRDFRRVQSLEDFGDQLLSQSLTEEAMEPAMRETIESLPELEQQCVMLRVQGNSSEEIANRIHRSRRTAECLLESARKHLSCLIDSDD